MNTCLRPSVPYAIASLGMAFALAGCGTVTPLAPSAPGASQAPAIAPTAVAAAPIDPIGRFPLTHYDQHIDRWLPPDAPDYDAPVIAPATQRARMAAFVARYFGTDARAQSPWNPAFIRTVTGSADLVATERYMTHKFDNRGKPPSRIGYGMNFQPHDAAWIDTIAANMRLDALAQASPYDAQRRAIAVGNLQVRELPTDDPFFYDHRLAGEGYPFDNLQVTAVWAGTPLYILHESLDHNWLFVQTPDVIGWVRHAGVARVSDDFVQRWRHAAAQGMGAVIRTGMAMRDTSGHFRFTAYMGAVFPRLVPGTAGAADDGRLRLMIPAMNADRQAVIRYADVATSDAVPMPLPATRRNFAMLMKIQQGRPYGWGNLLFDNDCSAELKSLFAPMGIWLPRNSRFQVDAGQVVDLTGQDTAARLRFLAEHGKPLATLVQIPGHIMLYLGNDPRSATPVPVTYQDIWGLSPADNSRRAIIGRAVVLPLLETYPEDPTLQSLAAKRFFRLSFLDGAPAPSPNDHLMPAEQEMPQ